MSDLRSQIESYLGEAKLMQIATSVDGKPWIANVWYVADDSFNIYWISATNRRHSRDIEANPHVAASMCVVQEPGPSDKGAIQIEGTAAQLHGAVEIAKALKLYVKRGFFTADQVKKFMSDPTRPHRFYSLKPQKIVYFDPTLKESTQTLEL